MQVFQTLSPRRWLRFKWVGRFLVFLVLLSIAVVGITLWRGYTPALPRLISDREKQALLDTSGSWVFNHSKIARQYGGFRKFINEKEAYNRGSSLFSPHKKRGRKRKQRRTPSDTALAQLEKFPTGIRAAFYVDWNTASLPSLEKNISHLNLVIPEWIFIDPKGDTAYINIDAHALGVMRKAGVKIMPILSNAFQQQFRGDVVHRILNDSAKSNRLINDVLAILEKNDFAGVNVDFEELREKSNETLVRFEKGLYEKLHAKGFLVTQNIAPFNSDYNYTELAKYNDYLFLMAYDQFSESTAPGPICHQKWIEAAVGEAASKIPTEKLILNLAGFGYDWVVGKSVKARPITYQQALSRAREFEATVDFDNDSYNLHFKYSDDANVEHQVNFTDAATAFNALRFATEYGVSGVALWYLGSEDDRIWKFYDRDMRKDSIRKFDFKDFTTIESSGTEDNVDYDGEGEVLDITGIPRSGRITPEVDTKDMLISEETYDTLPSKWVGRKYGTNNPKKLVLTFDDGPDPTYTPQILDILQMERVPATFFIVGLNAENNIPIVKRIFREGHEIGNHTFTHPNIANVSRKRAVLEMESTRLLIECITGHSTILFRPPYNADFEPQKAEELIPVAIAHSKNYLDVGESIDPLDWLPEANADSIFNRVVRRKQDMTKAGLSGNIILLHDAGGETRRETVKALPRIIQYFKDRGYTFTTIADLLGKKRDELMPPVPRGSGYFLIQLKLNYILAEIVYWSQHTLFALFVVFIILSLARIIFLAALAIHEKRKENKALPLGVMPFAGGKVPFGGGPAPLVSIIVPAYNEEVNAVSSLANLLNTTYPNIEVIFVDDGSKDNTYEKVRDVFSNHPKVKVLTKPNGGKASALNMGIAHSSAEYVVCIDADTKLHSDAVSWLMQHFFDDDGQKVGAVAGNVKVGNRVNALTKWQSIEYITSQNFDRRAFASVNAITVVPGAIGAFRKKAINEAGGFTIDTLAEDCDLTIRILRYGYVVKNEQRAIAYTEAPETVKMWIRQRFRWCFGVMQTLWKNRDVLFNDHYPSLGWVALPNILLFQFIIPIFSPLADIFMIAGLVTSNTPERILIYYGIFMVVDLAVALLAYSFENEKKSALVWIIPQRLIYRWLMLFVLFKAFLKAIKGELQGWGVLKRTGRVKELHPVTE